MMIRQSDQSANISASLLSAPSHVPVGLNNKHPPVSDSFYGNSELFPVKDYKPESEFPCDAGYGFFSFIFMCLAGDEKKNKKQQLIISAEQLSDQFFCLSKEQYVSCYRHGKKSAQSGEILHKD